MLKQNEGWKKAEKSAGNGQCVEVNLDGDVGVRDSKDPTGPALRFTRKEWAAFIDGVKKGEFDLQDGKG